mmetsp:Transcript_4289/g.7154  ORF Transcript_4289/g.7154 Transcript_4289/m.7154 type:complete len:225 (+) Transcript_4289:131-805(+)|eukprot:CAMPEP_0119007006 /NCGR_PEP_ID=MMETSP1176-20130426/2701_1 /TAXON_ID=265551 /ORGANISM="Synedropsis recta cf, Strain CCMP1620" /LENGTH=224 /DNA_ID=CAMNT_0006959057 /DNA_START=120 /DNA_END=794 /DNA_ORIENTATION=+
MPIVIAPRQPKLLTADQRCPSAEMEISRSKAKNAVVIAPPVKNNVRFYEIVSIRSTTHINDMTDEEVASAWFNRREMMTIKRALATEVKFMVAGKTTGPNTTSRGLEFRTKEGSAKRRANKLDSIHAVLDEQDLQHMRGIIEPEGLRKVYTSHSRRCLSASQALGRADEIETRLRRKAEMEEEEMSYKADEQSLKNDSVFVRLFSKKIAVMEEIKQMKISPSSA